AADDALRRHDREPHRAADRRQARAAQHRGTPCEVSDHRRRDEHSGRTASAHHEGHPAQLPAEVASPGKRARGGVSRARMTSLAHEDEADGPPQKSVPPWIVTFADLSLLLLCFFVLMLSFSEMDVAKFKLLAGSMHEAFGVQTEINTNDPPKGTSIVAREFSPAVPEPTDVNEIRQHTVDSDLNTLDLGLKQRLRELKAQEEAAEQQTQRLREVFRSDVEGGKLVVRRDGANVVIQILEKDSFPSGSAALDAPSLDTLAKIGAVVSAMHGAIAVSGHTDNVPVRNASYR